MRLFNTSLPRVMGENRVLTMKGSVLGFGGVRRRRQPGRPPRAAHDTFFVASSLRLKGINQCRGDSLITFNDRQLVDGLMTPKTLPQTSTREFFNRIGQKLLLARHTNQTSGLRCIRDIRLDHAGDCAAAFSDVHAPPLARSCISSPLGRRTAGLPIHLMGWLAKLLIDVIDEHVHGCGQTQTDLINVGNFSALESLAIKPQVGLIQQANVILICRLPQHQSPMQAVSDDPSG